MQPKGLLKFLRLEGFIQNLTEYFENKIAITKLEYKQKLIDVIVMAAVLVPVLVLALFALTFLSIGLAMALNVWLDSRAWGFVIVGGLYLLLAVGLFTQRNAAWLKKKIGDGTTKFLKEKPKPQKREEYHEPTYQAANVDHKRIVFEDEPAAGNAPTATNREPAVPGQTYGGNGSYAAPGVKEPKMASEVVYSRTISTEEETK